MIRFYRVLLRLYPRSFRTEYGAALVADFADRWARHRGGLVRLGVLAAAVADVASNAALVHWDILRQDLRQTRRTLTRARGFAVTAVLILALGVGANTAAFSVADFVLLRPLPFPEADRLVRMWQHVPGYRRTELSPGNYRDWRAMNTTIEALAAWTGTAVNLVGTREPIRLEAARVTGELFDVLGVPPLLGRLPEPHDSTERDARSIVLSHGLWQTLFGGDRDVIGRPVTLDGGAYDIVAVMPPGFNFPTRHAQLWIPLRFGEADYVDRTDTYLQVVARLRPGITLAQVRADFARVTAELERRFPRENERTGATVIALRDTLSANARLLLVALCGAALCILLLACANLANLLLARAAARERELAVRAALGAGRDRLLRQMTTETLILAVLGGLAGVLVAIATVPLLARLIPDSLPIAAQPSLDARVLALAALFTTVTGLGFGVLPALRASGRQGLAALRHGTRAGGGRRQRLRGALVALEVMSSVVLVVSAGLLVRAVWRLQNIDPGFRAQGVLTLQTALPMPKYQAVADRERFYARVLGAVRTLPGVEQAAYISFLPMVMGGGIWPVTLPGEAERRGASNTASLRFVTPGFFATMGIPIVTGRDVDETDTFDRPLVAVVSESFVRRHWPDEPPLGKRFRFGFDEWSVAGVVRDIRVRGLEQTSEPQVYLPYRQVRDGQQIFYAPKHLVIRSTTPPATLIPAVREIVRAADPEQPVSDVRTLEEIVAEQTASRRVQLRVLGALAGVALLLAGVGIHGLLAYLVTERRREIGVRLALGARPRGIARMILREGTLLALAGIIPGVALAYAAARSMEALLAGVSPLDPITVGVAVIACGAITVVGSLVPALRASRVDPMAVMRLE